MKPFAPLLLDGFDSREDIEYQFQLKKGFLKDHEIYIAYYSCENYEGRAYVLFEKDGNLYEVDGSHCSCYGLEGQWEPGRINLKYLKMREFYGMANVAEKVQELLEFLK